MKKFFFGLAFILGMFMLILVGCDVNLKDDQKSLKITNISQDQYNVIIIDDILLRICVLDATGQQMKDDFGWTYTKAVANHGDISGKSGVSEPYSITFRLWSRDPEKRWKGTGNFNICASFGVNYYEIRNVNFDSAITIIDMQDFVSIIP